MGLPAAQKRKEKDRELAVDAGEIEEIPAVTTDC